MKNAVAIARRAGLWIVLLLLGFAVRGQITIKGTVRNTAQEIIPFANVYLQTADTTTVLAFAGTDEQGQFLLEHDTPGHFILNVVSLGYTAYRESVALTAAGMQRDIILEAQDYTLREVTVTAEVPIIIREDTLIFNAASFADGSEAVVEDLLKKLPGFEVAEDGGIRINGKSIEKVMVEGDDLFKKGYRMLTKNLSAELIDNVEVLNDYHENVLLKDIEDSDKVAVNLTLDKERVAVFFGNAELGHSAAEFYESRINLISFLGDWKFYSLTNMNNTGKDPNGDFSDFLPANAYQSGEESVFGAESGARYLIERRPQVPELKAERVNFNNAEFTSLNFIHSPHEKTKIRGMAYFSADESDFFRDMQQEYFLPNGNLSIEERFQMRNRQKAAAIELDIRHEIGEQESLDYTGKYSRATSGAFSQLQFNDDRILESLDYDQQTLEQRLNYTRKLNDRQVLLLDAFYGREDKPQWYRVGNAAFAGLFNDDHTVDSLQQLSRNRVNVSGLTAKLLSKKGAANWEHRLGLTHSTQYFRSDLSAFEQSLELGIPADTYTNDLKLGQTDLWAASAYRHQLSSRFSLSGTLEGHYLLTRRDDLNREQPTPGQYRDLYLIPKIGFKWEPDKKNKIVGRYTYGTDLPSLLDIFSGKVLTGYRNLKQGADRWQPLKTSTLFANYAYGGWSSSFLFNANILYAKAHQYFSSRTEIGPELIQASGTILENAGFLNAGLSLDKYFKSLGSNVKLTASYARNTYQNALNDGALRQVHLDAISLGGEIRSVFAGIFNFHTGFNQQASIYNASGSNKIERTFLDIQIQLGKRFSLHWENDRYTFRRSFQPGQIAYFSDLELQYNFKKEGLLLTFLINNIFDNKVFMANTVTDTDIAQVSFRLIPRYALLKLQFRF
ncbi:carboxypeptidase regulatory-like domain-containing protein [Flavilitoribacter nigricans]|uniref:TonB-dependent receptor n=1 Tax=Flavilitoribacter nigricans (strain ATCC 23147 / DSM 23189 / NBRC 102662 / NCIMB 1420 / SS-2) TaxID=1122177 RepID=A0A2D0N8E4_FLAN2|nr:carboxypeptidase-like regulatory domain-containing protein [Flavilitoribacter nigricans]PHN04784.1 hypothetical protein CRP01_19935 [Flavilitoribacter nigricans DSM 23189 = NBRC 102662]